MSTPLNTGWHEANQRYLAAALNWLRLRLESQAGVEPSLLPQPAATTLAVATPSSTWQRLFGKTSPSPPAVAPSKTVALLPAGSPTSEFLAQAAEAMVAAETSDPPPALILLAERFGLSRFERQLLLLCVGMELDTRIAPLCARVQADPNRPYPTFALGLALLDDPAWDSLSPERPLRYWRLIEVHQPGAQPLTLSPLRADERIVNHVKGLNYLDDRLTPLLAPLDAGNGSADADRQVSPLPPSQQAAVETIVRRLERSAKDQHWPLIQLAGTDASIKRLIARQAAAAFHLHIYRLPAELLPAQAGELETLVRLWQRESVLLPVALYLDVNEMERIQPSEGPASPLHRFLERHRGVTFLDIREALAPSTRPTLTLEIAKPTPAEQHAAWIAAFGEEGGGQIASRLTSQFNLSLSTIRDIARTIHAEPPQGGRHLEEQLWCACRASTSPRLGALAQRLEPKATWKDIVLGAPELNILRQVANQVGQRCKVYEEWGFGRRMSRGLGISALFSGESGTGKTMAAEVIANDLQLHLYRIDLSAVVSKYIGETEKNLRRLFDAAEDGGAILFFDEADALFGKRSEVKDSHDRYANIEINYLLQRIEAYKGLAILATNMKNALDTAFLRRLRFIVNFAFPGVAERKLIWQKVFPVESPLDALDFDRLARLNLTGGSINNIAVNAAFLAAQLESSVTMALILEAARAEFRKLEKPINDADFSCLEAVPAGAKQQVAGK